MVKAIIFDCFGVLLTDALTAAMYELRKTDPEKAARISGIVQLASRGLMSPAESRVAVAAELGISPEEYSQNMRNEEVKNIELLNLIKELKKSYKIGLLSNVISGGLEIRFTESELQEHFDSVVASGDIGIVKPDPRIYILTCERLRVAPDEALMIDDSEQYVEGARQQGLSGIVYEDMHSFKAQLNELLNTNY